MIYRNHLIIGAALILLLAGCNTAEKDKGRAAAPGSREAGHGGDSPGPYFAGLIEEYKMQLAADPNNLAAIIAVGNAYLESGQCKKAIGYYEHALKIDPHNADVRTDMGACYRSIGMIDRALAEYRLALKHDSGHLNARYCMGVVYAFEKKDYPAAITVWEEVLRLSPAFPMAEQMRAHIRTFKKAMQKDGSSS